MKCPKCGEEDFFEVEAWEVTTYTAYTNNVDIESTKHGDTVHVALEPDSNASCRRCHHSSVLADFGPSFPFPILKRPSFEERDEPGADASVLLRAINAFKGATEGGGT
jgi:hypothetical protein